MTSLETTLLVFGLYLIVLGIVFCLNQIHFNKIEKKTNILLVRIAELQIGVLKIRGFCTPEQFMEYDKATKDEIYKLRHEIEKLNK